MIHTGNVSNRLPHAIVQKRAATRSSIKLEEIHFECLYNEDMIAIEVCYNLHSSRCK